MISFIHPTLEVLQLKPLPEDDDMALLERLARKCWDGTTAQEFAQLVFNRKLKLYRTPTGLILLETVLHTRGRELVIYGMAGRGMLNEAVFRDLKRIAGFLNCSMIGADGVPRAWMREARRWGFKPVSTHYVMEMTDGQ